MELVSPLLISDYAIAIVEDEPILREELAFQLRHLGFMVEAFEGAAAFYRHLAMHPCEIAVLDIGLDGEDGLSIARYLRTHDPQMGLIFLTARSLMDERMEGLALGADAYLTKPVELNELVLVLQRQIQRIHALTQGKTPQEHPVATPSRERVQWHLMSQGVALIAPNGAKVSLTVTEAELLRWLMSREGSLCTHAELGAALNLLPEEFDKHRVEVIVSRLRAKVQRQTGLQLPLKSQRGQGYLFSYARGNELLQPDGQGD